MVRLPLVSTRRAIWEVCQWVEPQMKIGCYVLTIRCVPELLRERISSKSRELGPLDSLTHSHCLQIVAVRVLRPGGDLS